MHHPEHINGYELASETALKQLYISTAIWLHRHGTYVVEPLSEVQGSYNGLPIIDDPPLFSLDLDENKVRAVSPQAADILELEGKLEMDYRAPHYNYINTSLEYVGPSIVFDIPQSKSSPIKSKRFYIHINDMGKAEGGFMNEPRDRLKPDQETSEDERLKNLIEAWILERETGVDQITAAQCQVLQEIINGLASAKSQAAI